MRLVHGTKIKEELRLVAPKQIAVAYIGADWQSFIDPDRVEEIIVSPTIGSSPEAIADLVRKFTWKRVHFLNELHAKIFIGQSSAAVGSFNLSANGMSGLALYEAGYVVETTSELEELKGLFDRIKARAIQQYKTEASKEKQLSKLCEISERARAAGSHIARSTTSRSLEQFEPVTETDFYCTYHEAEELEINSAAMRKQVPEKFTSPDTDPYNLMAYHLSFLEDDDVHPGHWILSWQAGQGTDVPDPLEVDWMYVNAVIPNGAVDEVTSYTKLAVQWTDASAKGRPPFKIGKREKRALREVLLSGNFPEFLPYADRQKWLLKDTFGKFKEFVAAWKAAAAAA